MIALQLGNLILALFYGIFIFLIGFIFLKISENFFGLKLKPKEKSVVAGVALLLFMFTVLSIAMNNAPKYVLSTQNSVYTPEEKELKETPEFIEKVDRKGQFDRPSSLGE